MDSMFNTPQEVVQANMNGAVKKATTSKKKVFFMGIMAGVCIALGAQSSNVAMHDIANVGLARLVAGCVFPVGLMMIVFIGGELFTGDCMMTMACIKKKISVAALIRTLVIVYIGNMVGAVALAYLVYLSGQYNYTSGALGAFTIKVAVGKSLAIFFPIMAFVVSGFEHCVANMYYIPAGIFASMNPDYVAKAKELYGITGSQIAALNWGNFFTINLLPVTIGNIIGGGFIIGGLFFYLHGKNCK